MTPRKALPGSATLTNSGSSWYSPQRRNHVILFELPPWHQWQDHHRLSNSEMRETDCLDLICLYFNDEEFKAVIPVVSTLHEKFSQPINCPKGAYELTQDKAKELLQDQGLQDQSSGHHWEVPSQRQRVGHGELWQEYRHWRRSYRQQIDLWPVQRRACGKEGHPMTRSRWVEDHQWQWSRLVPQAQPDWFTHVPSMISYLNGFF